MTHEAEISTIDLRYENYRMRDRTAERRLLSSIMERGIEEPLEGVDVEGVKILLNGFKRYRCAKKLKLGCVPYVSLGADEASAIMALLRTSVDKSLSILEQARFIEELQSRHQMTTVEIAEKLSRSKGWVSMRTGLLSKMGQKVQEKILKGLFPMYSYMYTARRFMRMNGVKRNDVEEFILAVSGKNLSIRDIERLAYGYFEGPEWFAGEVRNGNLTMLLERMKNVSETAEGCTAFERSFLRDLEHLGKYMRLVVHKHVDRHLISRAFAAQANLLATGILSRMNGLTTALKELYDRTGHA